MKVHIFGYNSTTGIALEDLLKKNLPTIDIIKYSRTKKNTEKFNFKEPNKFNFKNIDEKSIFICLGPIWDFSDFLEKIFMDFPSKVSNISSIIACSSTSIITKKHSTNNFDKKLVKKLELSEKNLKKICSENLLNFLIIRPTIIYGDLGFKKDKNINKIKNIIKYLPIIFLPRDSGLRQPIHAKQLGLFIFKCIENLQHKEKEKSFEEYNIGGDEEINYSNMIKRIKKKSNNFLKNKCIFIFIPNRILFFILSPILIISPKNYSAILRINADMAGFIKVSNITSTKKKKFLEI